MCGSEREPRSDGNTIPACAQNHSSPLSTVVPHVGGADRHRVVTASPDQEATTDHSPDMT